MLLQVCVFFFILKILCDTITDVVEGNGYIFASEIMIQYAKTNVFYGCMYV